MTSKRERELARAKWERQQIRRAQDAEKKSVVKRSAIAGAAIVAVIVLILSNQSNGGTSSALPTRTPYPSNTSVFTPTQQPSSPVSKVCQSHAPLTSTPMSFTSAPTEGPSAKNLKLDTNCGSINITLDSKAPKTTQIMANLAKKGYFNNTPCHRLTTNGIYVLQCGDPTGTGTGSPGFTFADENLPKVQGSASFVYTRGTIAMANSGPNTNGSQFFIVYKASPLPPNYSIWGQVTNGLDVVDKIAAAGESSGQGDGKPNADVAIAKAIAN